MATSTSTRFAPTLRTPPSQSQRTTAQPCDAPMEDGGADIGSSSLYGSAAASQRIAATRLTNLRNSGTSAAGARLTEEIACDRGLKIADCVWLDPLEKDR